MKVIYKNKYYVWDEIITVAKKSANDGTIIDKIILSPDEYKNLHDRFSSSLDFANDRAELITKGTVTLYQQTIKIEGE